MLVRTLLSASTLASTAFHPITATPNNAAVCSARRSRPNILMAHPALTDLEWHESVLAGCNLLEASKSTDKDAAKLFPDLNITSMESEFKDYEDFHSWGYIFDEQCENAFMEDDDGPDLKALMNGVDYMDRDNYAGPFYLDAWTHEVKTIHKGTVYLPTEANFWTIFNPDQGIIIGWSKYGPAHMGDKQIPRVTTLPDLKRWADIAFLGWQQFAKLAEHPIKTPKYIISADVQNPETVQILERALGVTDVRDSCESYRWGNHVDFGMNTAEGKALLGSPNGRGSALLLIMHKKEFGERTTIKKVRFWCGQRPDIKYTTLQEIQLMFYV